MSGNSSFGWKVFAFAFALTGAAWGLDLDLDDAVFDGGELILDGGVEIVNGAIVLKGAETEAKPAEPDPAGEEVLELTDGSQLHGRLLTLGKNEVVWQRTDAKEPLTFTPQEVRRLVLGAATKPAADKAQATLKLAGSDWLAGELVALREGKFQLQLGATALEIERGKVEWLQLSPGLSPDAYAGPLGPLGLAGWEGTGDGSVWDYADGALVAKSAAMVSRTLAVVPERLDVQFTASDGGSGNRGLTVTLQAGAGNLGYGKGSFYLRFQSNSVSLNSFNGEQNPKAEIPEQKDDKKQTRYRLLFDRRAGRLVVLINGKQVADWKLAENKEPTTAATLSWQPTYWNSNTAWTLSSVSVQPWDGDTAPDGREEERGKDLIKAAPTERKAGALQAISAEAVQFSDAQVSRKDAIFLRLAATTASEPPPSPIARVWLAGRGEFDVAALGFRDGVLKVRTAFAGDIALPVAAVRAIEFPHRIVAPPERTAVEGGDTLIFRNGDQLRGTLIEASHDQPIRWKPAKSAKIVEFKPSQLSGVLLAARKKETPVEGGAALRFQNGDWLAGGLVAMDAQTLRFRTPFSSELQIARDRVKTLYFSASDAEAPVWDGASQREEWQRGTAISGYSVGENRSAKKDEKKPSPWRYLDGAYTIGGGRARVNNVNLGRALAALPEKVEMSFDLSAPHGSANYSVQLFSDDNKPGLMVQGSWDSAYLYDMSPRRQGNIFGNQPQQIEFGKKVSKDGNRRSFRFLGDRRTGQLWMFVNGKLAGQLNHRNGADNPKPGKGIAIFPLGSATRMTISNLWVAPWTGTAPAPMKDDKKNKEPAEEEPPAEPAPVQDAVALVNGDETLGTVKSATAEELRVQCEVGDLAIPLKRAVLVDFAAKTTAATPGMRLRFATKGALTVQTFRLSEGKIFCHSENAGDLDFPLAELSEIIFQPDAPRPFENAAATEGTSTPGGPARMLIRGQVIINH